LSRPAVLFGGPSPEHDISIILGLLATRALTEAGVEVEALYWTKAAEFVGVDAGLEAKDFLEGVPRGARPLRLGLGGFEGEAGGGGFGRKKPAALDISAVLNCCHGGPGEDGTLQGALDLAGIRYTGPTVAGAALGMDKLAFAGVVTAAGLPHLPVVALDPTDPGPAPFDGPYIVKPRFGGSSIGIEVLEDWDSVAAFVRSPQPHLRAGAVVEPYKAGSYDLNIAVRTHPEVQLSAIEKPLRSTSGASILDYKDKYVGGEGMVSAPKELPAQIPAAWEEQIRSAARRLVPLAAVRGIARIDFLAVGDGPDDLYVNEINTIPGSLAKHLWIDPPIPTATLLQDLLTEATSGPGRPYSTQGADGSALRSAGSISGKLG
jgi:D-alanine-D-alanine ligase